MSFLAVLEQWNRWGKALLSGGLIRDITPKVIGAIDIEHVVVLIGPRRAGKSTILYQVIDHLEKIEVDPKAILHINFEDPALSNNLNLELLDALYDEYRAKIYPQGKAYLFFDEIQRVPMWERWVRTRNETEDIKIFITGSSAQLMSRELATLLTGRHISFTILPLSFAEFLRFNDINVPEKTYAYKAPAIISNALMRYCAWGGYPGIVLLDKQRQKFGASNGTLIGTEMLKQQLLLEYFDDTLFKDVALRHNIRDLKLLRNLAIHLLGQTAGKITYKRLANVFSASPDVIQNYCMYLQEAFLIDTIEFFSLKVAERHRNPHKIHVVDLGLRNLLYVGNSADTGKIEETLVYNRLKDLTKHDIYYYQQDGEIDLLTHRGSSVQQLIQVMHKGLDDPKVMNRELKSLLSAKEQFPKAEAMLIVGEFPVYWTGLGEEFKNSDIQIISLWRLLLGIQND